jgi:hypothetical protein
MKGSFNLSKGDHPWRDWPQAREYYGTDVVNTWIAKEVTVEQLIMDAIAKKLSTY